MKTIEIDTKSREEIVDITEEVRKVVENKSGLLFVFSTHTTTGVTINEAETGLLKDLLRKLSDLVPHNAGYIHDRIDTNADAHIKASILGNSVFIPVENGRLMLGTWQRILFVEFDGPRRRRVHVIFYETEKD